MTVAELDKVDIVAAREEPPLVRLVVSDHLDWDDESRDLSLLQEKLNRYLAFAEGGELRQKYPAYAGYPVEIQVAFLHAPTDSARESFLLRAREVVRAAGYELSWSTRGAG